MHHVFRSWADQVGRAAFLEPVQANVLTVFDARGVRRECSITRQELITDISTRRMTELCIPMPDCALIGAGGALGRAKRTESSWLRLDPADTLADDRIQEILATMRSLIGAKEDNSEHHVLIDPQRQTARFILQHDDQTVVLRVDAAKDALQRLHRVLD